MSLKSKIMIGIPVKNSARYLDRLWKQVRHIDYPKNCIRCVFIYGESKDNTLKKLKKIARNKSIKVEVYEEPHERNIRLYGEKMGASIYKDFKDLLEEDYFLYLDSDVAKIPRNILKNFLQYNEDIVAPYVLIENRNQFYDTWVYRINNKRFSHIAPPGLGLDEPFEAHSVGTCFLVRKDVLEQLEPKNPYPDLQMTNFAFRLGYRVMVDPTTLVFHSDLTKDRIYHLPLPKEFGGYPSPGFVTVFDPVVTKSNKFRVPLDVNFSGNPVQLKYEHHAYIQGLWKYTLLDEWRVKGKRWSYNYMHFNTFWNSAVPGIVDFWFKHYPYPWYIEVEATTVCNLRCKMCEHTYWNEKPRHMSLDEFKYIIDQFKDLKEMGFTGIGESFLNPEYIHMIEYVKKHRTLFLEIFDSFFYLDEELCKELIKTGIDKVYCSFDAATKETYEKLRVGAKFDDVVENIKTFDRMKKKLGYKHYPKLCFHYIINRDNIHEAVQYLDFVKSLDVDVFFVQYSEILHDYPEIHGMKVEVPDSLIREINTRARELGLRVYMNVNVYPDKPCNQCILWSMPFIFVDGTVIPCCPQNEANRRDYQRKTSMGNIFEQSFKDIWYGKEYTKLRKLLYKGKFHPSCIDCPIFKEINP